MTVLASRPGAEVTAVAASAPAHARWQRNYVVLLVVLDSVVLLVAGMLATWLRFRSNASLSAMKDVTYLQLSVLVVPVWLGVLALGRCYESRFLSSGNEEFRRVLDASVRFLALIGLSAYATKTDVARGYLSVLLASGLVLLLLGRFAARMWVHRARRRGRCVHRVVVVGQREAVGSLVTKLHSDPLSGLQPVAACTDGSGDVVGFGGASVPVLGGVGDVMRVLADSGADTVAVAAGAALTSAELERLSHDLEGTGVDLLVQPKLTSVFGTRISVRPVAGLPLMHIDEPELTGSRRLVKGVFDRLLAALLLLLVAPVLLVLAVLVRLTSRGPAFFRQRRVGRRGRTFTIWKLRTMYVDAEARRAQVLHHNKHGVTGVLFKLEADPRVTPVGRFLRRYSLDELPQLLNVLGGQMSLVGPRPPLPEEVERYTDLAHRRLLVKPGMTGLWQVSGRSDLSWEESVSLDLRYVENWSLGLDLLLLVRTVMAVLRPRGAY